MWLLLATAKAARSAALFAAVDLLVRTDAPIALFLCLALAGTAGCLALLRPRRHAKLEPRHRSRLAAHAATLVLSLYLWCYGLKVCGPVITVLLDTSELGVTAAFLLAHGVERRGARRRVRVLAGVVALIIAYAVLLLGAPLPSPRPGGSEGWLGKAALLLAATITAVRKVSSRRLARELGGAARLFGLSTAFGAAMLVVPAAWTCWQLESEMLLAMVCPSSIVRYVLFVLFRLVINFHIDSAANGRLPTAAAACVSLVVSFGCSCSIQLIAAPPSLVSLLSPSGKSPSVRPSDSIGVKLSATTTAEKGVGIGVLAGVCTTLCLAHWALLSTGGTNGLYSELGAADGASLLPTSKALRQETHSFASVIRGVASQADSRRLAAFLVLNLIFMLVEATVGFATNSLSLVTDSAHMALDCMALAIGLVGACVSRWQTTREYPYGYGRFEVLCGFVNSLLLLLVAASVLVEAISRFRSPPVIDDARLLPVAFAGLLVNVVGLLNFHQYHHPHGGGGCSGCDDAHGGGGGGENMRAVFLHVLADALGSVGALLSAVLSRYLEWHLADPTCSVIVALMIGVSVVPLIWSSAAVLLLVTPEPLRSSNCYNEIIDLAHVRKILDMRFWHHTRKHAVGTCQILATPSANEAVLAREVSRLVRTNFGVSALTVQVVYE